MKCVQSVSKEERISKKTMKKKLVFPVYSGGFRKEFSGVRLFQRQRDGKFRSDSFHTLNMNGSVMGSDDPLGN